VKKFDGKQSDESKRKPLAIGPLDSNKKAS
jgi:hypothetical protein